LSETRPIPGSCLCGGVQFELEPPFLPPSHCHCEHCRKHSGNSGNISMGMRREQLRLLSGEELLAQYEPAPGCAIKVFCRRCGSGLFALDQEDGEKIWVRLGSLDTDPGVRVDRHTWVRSAPAWLSVPDDGLPRYATGL
jgi:hypothetical protein